MKILSLERLEGPGNSTHENFEILCLESIKAVRGPSSYSYRVSAPDKGVDIFSESEGGPVHAYQCKAYARYSSSLITELRKSIAAANKNYSNKPWDLYMLMIPFVPTAVQRERIEAALKDCKGNTYIIDGDELETRLFEFPEITTRFFPSVVFVFPPRANEIRLVTDDRSNLLTTYLESVKTGNRIPIVVSSNATCHGLTNLLITTLKLPEFIIVTGNNLFETRERIHWRLSVVDELGQQQELGPEITIGEADPSRGRPLRLSFQLEINERVAYQKPFGYTKRVYYLHSNIWEEKHMNPNLIQMPGLDRISILDNKAETLSRYIDWHLSDLLK